MMRLPDAFILPVVGLVAVGSAMAARRFTRLDSAR
jgi:hypothetical protein